MPKGYLYVLRSEQSGRYYVGSAVDPDRRLHEHNIGHVKATRGKGPWVHARVLAFPTAEVARRAEYHVKRQKRRSVVEAIVAGTYIWAEELTPLLNDRA